MIFHNSELIWEVVYWWKDIRLNRKIVFTLLMGLDENHNPDSDKRCLQVLPVLFDRDQYRFIHHVSHKRIEKLGSHLLVGVRATRLSEQLSPVVLDRDESESNCITPINQQKSSNNTSNQNKRKMINIIAYDFILAILVTCIYGYHFDIKPLLGIWLTHF